MISTENFQEEKYISSISLQPYFKIIEGPETIKIIDQPERKIHYCSSVEIFVRENCFNQGPETPNGSALLYRSF